MNAKMLQNRAKRSCEHKKMQLKNSHEKIHTHPFVRLRRRLSVQTVRRKLYQSILLLIICNVLHTCVYKCTVLPSSRSYPRVIQFNENEIGHGNNYKQKPHRKVDLLSHFNVKRDKSKSPFEEGNCKAMHQWQVNYNAACNNIHEIDGLEMQHLAKGGFRDVWWIRDGDGSHAVIKTLVWKKKFSEREKARHQRDANAYTALQSSKSIPNIYGFCTNTAVFDYCKQGTLDDMLEDENEEFMSTWTSEDVLRYAWQISKALADVHSVGDIHKSAAIAHTDISPDQFLWMDGMFKLNDFNRARFIRWDAVEKNACPFYISVNKGKHRSPEEYTKHHPLTEKIDVFALGNILYTILMRRDVYEDMKSADVQESVKSGIFITIPTESMMKFTSMEKAVATAMSMCLVEDVEKRQSAMDVERFLRKKLEEYDVSKF